VRTHQDIDRRSLEMVRRIVARIDADPERAGLTHAKRVCERWVAQGIVSAREWLALLDRPWEDVRAILLDESDEGQRLRQTDRSAESSRRRSAGRFTARHGTHEP